MKKLTLLIFLLATMAAWQVNAAEFTGAKMIMTTPDGEMVFDLPTTGFPVADYTEYGQASSLVVNSFEVYMNDADQTNVSDVTLHVALYKQGETPDKWMTLPLNYIAGGSWGIDINKDLAEEDAGNYVLEIYVTAKNNGNDLILNNGGQNYKVMYAVGGGGESYNNVKWLTTGTAELILYNSYNDYPQYKFNGDGTRDNDTQPGSCDYLGINYFSIKYDLEEGTNIVSASLQYKIRAESSGDETGWNGIECNEVNTLISSRKNTHRSSMNEPRMITQNLEPGNYRLIVMYQLIDSEGKYYFFGRDNDNFGFNFSIDEPKDPEIQGISMVVTPTPGEQQYPWFESGETYDPIDLVKEDPLESMTLDEVFIFAQGRFDYLDVAFNVTNTSGQIIYGGSISTQFDDFGNWSNETQTELLKSELLENGKIYTLNFWAEGLANDQMYYLNNDGENYQVVFTYGTGGGTPGDLNGDGNVNTGDISALYSALLAGSTDALYDINGDGNINTGDVSALYQIILGQ